MNSFKAVATEECAVRNKSYACRQPYFFKCVAVVEGNDAHRRRAGSTEVVQILYRTQVDVLQGRAAVEHVDSKCLETGVFFKDNFFQSGTTVKLVNTNCRNLAGYDEFFQTDASAERTDCVHIRQVIGKVQTLQFGALFESHYRQGLYRIRKFYRLNRGTP